MKAWSGAIGTIVLGLFFSTMAFAQAKPATHERPTASIMQAKSTGGDSTKKPKKKGNKKHKGNKQDKRAEKKEKVPPPSRPRIDTSDGVYEL